MWESCRRLVVLGLLLTLVACSSSKESPAPPLGSGTGAQSPGDIRPVDVSGQLTAHIHNLGLDGTTLLLGTHDGLYEQRSGRQPRLLSRPPFDVMGFARAGELWLASGHPTSAAGLPTDLGLRESRDGENWTNVSLLGSQDFHRLTVSGSTVLGLSTHHGGLLMRSEDLGKTWEKLGVPGLFDVVLDPTDSSRVVATSPSGPMLSTSGGREWRRIEGAPVIAFVAWSQGRVFGLAPDGTLYRSDSAGREWDRTAALGDDPIALAAAGDVVAAVVGGSLVQSVDGGVHFTPRLVGLETM